MVLRLGTTGGRSKTGKRGARLASKAICPGHGCNRVFGTHRTRIGGRVVTRTFKRRKDAAVWGVRYRLHDLRHLGATLAAAAAASTKEVMRRIGHASPQAALTYQHATEERDAAIAAALAGLSPLATVSPLRPRDGRAMGTGGESAP